MMALSKIYPINTTLITGQRDGWRPNIVVGEGYPALLQYEDARNIELCLSLLDLIEILIDCIISSLFLSRITLFFHYYY